MKKIEIIEMPYNFVSKMRYNGDEMYKMTLKIIDGVITKISYLPLYHTKVVKEISYKKEMLKK